MSLQETFAPFELWCPISKIDQKQRIIAGYASVKGIDLQNELVTIPALKDAWAKFIANIDYAHVHVMHTNIPVGKVILEFTDSEGKVWKSGVDEVGLFIIVKIRDDIKKGKEVWQLITTDPPVLKGFSIGGEALAKVTIEKTGSNLSYDRIDKLELHEISVVDNPANQLALFQILKNANLVTRDQVLRHTPNLVLAKGAIKLTGSLVEHGYGERFGLAIPGEELTKFLPLFSNALRQEWLRTGRTDLITKSSTDTNLIGKTEDLYDLVLIKSGTIVYDGDVIKDEVAKTISQVQSEMTNTAQEAAGGFTPPVAKDEPSNVEKQGDSNVSEKIEKGDKDAQILALVQGFSKALTDLLTKKEETKAAPKEEKKAAEGAGTSAEIPGNGNTTAQEELSHGPCSAKKSAEEVEKTKCSDKKESDNEAEDVEKKVDPEALSKMVNDEVTKALEQRGLTSVKKSLAPGAEASDPNLIKKSDPLAMSLMDLNKIPIERIAKNYPGGKR